MTQPNHGGPTIVGGRLDLPYDADFTMEIELPDDDDVEPFLLTDEVSWRFTVDDEVVSWVADMVEDEDNPGTCRLMRWFVDVLDVAPVAAAEPDEARLHFVRDDVDLLWDVWRTRRV